MGLPRWGGAKTEQASPPAKTGGLQSDIIDLSCLSDDDAEATAVSVPASEAAPAGTASATAHAAHAATTQPPPTHQKRVRRNLQEPPRGHPLHPNVVPATIRALWQKVEGMYDRRETDPPLCPHTDCPYCTGALMEQRFDLMQRLVTLEKIVWLGDGRKKR